jgi:esterase/lipase superfamily enzyme
LYPGGFSSVAEISTLSPSKFRLQLQATLRNKQDGLFVFVHGFSTTFERALIRTAQLALDTNYNGSAICFSWPSRGHWSCYLADHDQISRSAGVLASFLSELRATHPTISIHVVAHSMGAEIATKALNQLTPFDASEVVLQAPDISGIDYPSLMSALVCRSQRITVYANEEDKALKASARARKGISGVVDVARVGENILNAIDSNVEAVDASRFGKDGFWSHSYTFTRPLLIDLRETLDAVPQVRAQLEPVLVRSLEYYRFRR